MIGKQEVMKGDIDDQTTKDVATTRRQRPHLPDHLIHQILPLLSTKSAVRMKFLSKKWNDVWPSISVLDFDEGNIDHELDDNTPRTFINVWERYVDEIRKNQKQTLHKFRLRMRYLAGDATMIDKWVKFAIERGFKELDINLPSTHDYAYSFSPRTFANAKSMTTLNLENVKIVWEESDIIRLPSLKSMSIKNVKFDQFQFTSLILLIGISCPSLEHLSFTSCTSPYICVSSSSLKSLEIINCSLRHPVQIQASNLVSFKFVSSLDRCCRLKNININIRASQLRHFALSGCKHEAMAKINISTSTPPLSVTFHHSETSITFPGRKLPPFDGSLEHFSALRDYLEKFDCSKDVSLRVRDYQVLIFPENFRKACSPTLPNLKHLEMTAKSPLTETGGSDLRDSLHWMAPSAEIRLRT